eukprot:COSAG06_NODE_5247_length_3612_cov_1.381725_5_plen_165_part_00
MFPRHLCTMLLVITPPMARSAKFWRVPAQQRSVTPSSHREEKAESLVRIYNIHQPYRCKSAISQIDLPCMPYGWYIGNRSTGYFVTYSAFAPVRLTCTGQSAVALVILASKEINTVKSCRENTFSAAADTIMRCCLSGGCPPFQGRHACTQRKRAPLSALLRIA